MHEARRRFSDLARRALAEGMQVVTRHGESTVVVIAAVEYERLRRKPKDFAEFLLDPSGARFDDLELEHRQRDLPRDVDL